MSNVQRMVEAQESLRRSLRGLFDSRPRRLSFGSAWSFRHAWAKHMAVEAKVDNMIDALDDVLRIVEKELTSVG